MGPATKSRVPRRHMQFRCCHTNGKYLGMTRHGLTYRINCNTDLWLSVRAGHEDGFIL
jgi:hypothetical protein